MFEECYLREPQSIDYGIPCFGNERDGDFYDEEDINAWNNGRFQNSLNNTKLIKNKATKRLLRELSKETCVVDLASGPGMGLIPSLLQINPEVSCMATDANLSLLKQWKSFLVGKPVCEKINFAQFSLMDIPFKDDSIPAYSSFIGLGSTRGGPEGYNRVTQEIFRTLKHGGKLFTVEAEWADIPGIVNLFGKMNRQPWDIFTQSMETDVRTWQDRFINNGFKILYQGLFESRSLRETDNELGEAAVRFGVNVEMIFNAFIVQKN